VLRERDETEDLHPACAANRCTEPVEAGGLGVVELHPVNAWAVEFYRACARLGPELAWRLMTPDAGDDRGLLARQLARLVEEWGAPWLHAAAPEPPPKA
jgi:hypothetical protein